MLQRGGNRYIITKKEEEGVTMRSKIRTLQEYIKILKLARKKGTIIIVAPYFNQERLKDGYYKRVKAVDELLNGHQKIYVSYEQFPEKMRYRQPEKDTVVVDYNPHSKKQKILVTFLMFICGKIYCHSVWQAKKIFYKIPFLKVYVDVHGVVPEEETLYERYEDAQRYGEIEEVVVKK